MTRIALLGDSIFDNAAYTRGGPAVVDHLQGLLPPGWGADLLAVDGATANDIAHQIGGVHPHHTHLVLSVGGNDALLGADLLQSSDARGRDALLLLADVTEVFDVDYRRAVNICLLCGLPLVVCTIYGCSFADAATQRAARAVLAVFNDVIIRTAVDRKLRVLDLRLVCTQPEDYVDSIEPSVAGGAKIARSVARAVEEGRFSDAGCRVAA
jgi:GDSL-like Lipase/Acylhydrolase family